MNRAAHVTWATFVLAVASALATPAARAADAVGAYDRYRCGVHDRAPCDMTPADAGVRIETRLVPGPYAQYLISRGQSQALALDSARQAGETAVLRTEHIARRTASAYETYRVVTGGLADTRVTVTTLAEWPLDAATAERLGALH